MTLVNRLSQQDPGRRHNHENVMMSDTMRAQLLPSCEQIRQHLAQGSESAGVVCGHQLTTPRP
ncbi:hypothetical protein [Aeromonas caviae]|uniref:hypothetical protein n=1 Tax=Aeromonas caviae TaxID=648 RepID=UPI0029DAA80C|nr:hypothetical protein [Aeromonas caviae]MDX7787732.1 hypothetical protein [Aeromonas caviae]